MVAGGPALRTAARPGVRRKIQYEPAAPAMADEPLVG